MTEIQYSEAAITDLDALHFYFAFERENPPYARRLLTELRETIEHLRLFPLLGVSRDAWQPGLRALMYDRYVILYSYLEPEDVVLIESVLDGRQDIENSFRDQ